MLGMLLNLAVRRSSYHSSLTYICASASAVVTLRNKVGETESSSFGGVIFARADNDAIQTVYDVNNRIVIASSVYDMGSGPMQWEEMRAAGEDLLFAPSQVGCPRTLEIFRTIRIFFTKYQVLSKIDLFPTLSR